MTRTGRRAAAGLLATVLALLLGALLATPASAHAQYVRSNPADGASLDASPAQLVVDLSQSVIQGRTRIVLRAGDGSVVPLTDVRIRETGQPTDAPDLIRKPGDKGAPTTITAALPPLGRDVYRIEWSTLSADDLHVTSGVIVFAVGEKVGAAAGRVADPAPGTAEVALRWVVLVAGGTAAAGLVLARLAAAARGAAVRRAVLVASAAGVVAGPLLLLVQAGGTTGLSAVLTSRSGVLTGVRVACLLALALAAAGARSRPGRRRLAAGLTSFAGFCVASVWLGHVPSEAGPVTTAADVVHVAAAVLWCGGLVLLAVAGAVRTTRGDGSRELLRAFGLVGVSCLAAVSVSGLLLAAGGVATLDAFLVSTYGRFVLAKAAGLALATAAAALVVAVVEPAALPRPLRARAARLTARAGLPAVAALELALVVAVTVLGAAAASSRPALGPEWIPTSQAAPLLSAYPADLVETFAVSPNRPGRNFVAIDEFDTRRPSPGPARTVVVSAVSPNGGVSREEAQPQGEGRWLLTTDTFDQAGAWTVTVAVERDGLPPATATYHWTVVDPGARLARPVVSSASVRWWLVGLAALVAVPGVLGVVGAVRRRRAAAPSGGTPADAAAQEADLPAAPAAQTADEDAAAGSGRVRV